MVTAVPVTNAELELGWNLTTPWCSLKDGHMAEEVIIIKVNQIRILWQKDFLLPNWTPYS